MKHSLPKHPQSMLLLLARLQRCKDEQGGYVIFVTAAMLVILASLFLTAAIVGKVDNASTTASAKSNKGFFAAEAGLNLRAKEIRDRFNGFNRPAGVSPTDVDNDGELWDSCTTGTDLGSGDFACNSSLTLQGKNVVTYVDEQTGADPPLIPIPDDELFGGLFAQEYRYDAVSVAQDSQNLPTSILGMRFKSRLVPLFQFVAFYDKDLEILPGPLMNLNGPIHVNGSLYLGSNATLNIRGRVSVSNEPDGSPNFLFRRRKNNTSCQGTVNIATAKGSNPPLSEMTCAGVTQFTSATDVSTWNGLVEIGANYLDVPPPEAIDPDPVNPDAKYWQKADLRIVMEVDAAGTPGAIEVRNNMNEVSTSATTALQANCLAANPTLAGAVAPSTTFYNHREGKQIVMLNVDLQSLFTCASTHGLMDADPVTSNPKALNDDSEGGLVWYFTVEGPNSNVNVNNPPPTGQKRSNTGPARDGNNYGIRIRNGHEFPSAVKGLTIVTDQAVYIQGDYNSVNKRPASFLSDSLNVLSNAWNITTESTVSAGALSGRVATPTAINAAFLSGTDSTGNSDSGSSGQSNPYNGGLENYPRFHENWSGQNLTYRGSFVSLGRARRVDGQWGSQSYAPPGRAWNFDQDFSRADGLPPMTPQAVYLKQELFQRSFKRASVEQPIKYAMALEPKFIF